jgi:hypothetical protein
MASFVDISADETEVNKHNAIVRIVLIFTPQRYLAKKVGYPKVAQRGVEVIIV